MSYNPHRRAKADKHDPALCLGAANILADNGVIGREPPVFIRPSPYEDKALGIDMLMRAIDEQGNEKEWKLAFRVRKEIKMKKKERKEDGKTVTYFVPLLDFRDKELEKIRTGKYQADFLIYADNSFMNIIIVDLKPWLHRNKDALHYDEFGEKKDDSDGNGKHYYSVEANDKGWQVIYYPMNFSGTKRAPYKARGELPNIFLTKEYYEEACVLSVSDDFKLEEYTWKP
ncbi:MAG: hypothetical protein P4L77_06485 [Sulfuriferula sp.]|nr:hypothetical protein [Sulfuriferula sp.]